MNQAALCTVKVIIRKNTRPEAQRPKKIRTLLNHDSQFESAVELARVAEGECH